MNTGARGPLHDDGCSYCDGCGVLEEDENLVDGLCTECLPKDQCEGLRDMTKGKGE